MMNYPFADLVSHRPCVLVINTGYPPVVEHPDCDQPADVAMELDAFYCQTCRWSGRISGAWVHDLLRAALSGVPDRSESVPLGPDKSVPL